MSFLGALVLLVNLFVFGAHAVVPLRIARRELEPSKLWALAAPLLLALSIVLTVTAVGRAPDEAVAWGLADPFALSPVSGVLAISVAALLVSDLVVAAGWRRMELAAWWPVAALGLLGVIAHAFGSELLRAGWGPAPSGRTTLLLIVLFRVPLALAAGELLAGGPRLVTAVAGPALLVSTALWPAAIRLRIGPGFATLAAASLLLLAARWLPARLRPPAAALGLLLAVLFLARAGEISRILGTSETIPDDLLVAP